MSRETDNKAIVGRWFEGFWANPWNPKIIDELAAPGYAPSIFPACAASRT
jgi:hypothetical protein